jgi:hypothetical protein
MSEFLRHPLTIAAIGIVITGLLAPSFTRRWQSQQKDVEVRVGLVADMSECAMDLITRVQAANKLAHLPKERHHKREERMDHAQQSLATERQRFEIREAVIHTKLEAYFDTTSIPKRWRDLAKALTALAELEGSPDGVDAAERRAAQLEGLLHQKATLIKDVLKQRSALQLAWIPERLRKLWIRWRR